MTFACEDDRLTVRAKEVTLKVALKSDLTKYVLNRNASKKTEMQVVW
jgi:hypothetical protein